MARNRDRYVSGPRELVEVQVASATVIQKGDFVAIDGNYAVPVGSMNDAGDAAANREAAADHFWGIAETASAAGETDPVLVDISNMATFLCELQAAATLSYGAALEIYSDGGACSNYQLVAGTTSHIAFAKETITEGTDIKVGLLGQAHQHKGALQT